MFQMHAVLHSILASSWGFDVPRNTCNKNMTASPDLLESMVSSRPDKLCNQVTSAISGHGTAAGM